MNKIVFLLIIFLLEILLIIPFCKLNIKLFEKHYGLKKIDKKKCCENCVHCIFAGAIYCDYFDRTVDNLDARLCGHFEKK